MTQKRIIVTNGKHINRQSLQLVMPYKNKEKIKEKWDDYWSKNKDQINQKHRENYDPVKEKIRKKIMYFKLKLDVFCNYSKGIPNCKVCNEENLSYLSIDHIKGNGNKHRKSINLNGGGVHFYRWLVKNCFPDGFQVLCYNHNMGKRFI